MRDLLQRREQDFLNSGDNSASHVAGVTPSYVQARLSGDRDMYRKDSLLAALFPESQYA